MATLREAVSQLDAAIQHLERTLESTAGSAGSDDAKSAQLRSALDDANRRNEELSDAAEQVALRLDRAVARVNAMLEA